MPVFLYSTGAKLLIREKLPDQCPYCGAQESLELTIKHEYRYVLLFIFPAGKVAVCRCTHCQQEMDEDQMPRPILAIARSLKARFRTPFWMYSGIILFVGIGAFAIIAGTINDRRIKGRIHAPLAGDILKVKKAPKQYTLYKVVQVVSDTIYYKENRYVVDDQSDLNNLNSNQAFSPDVNTMVTGDLETMYANHKLLDIKRP